MTDINIKQAYLNQLLDKYKNNPDDESLSATDKLLLQQAFSKDSAINKLLEQVKSVQEEIESKQRQLQLLDQQVVFERGQLAGILDSLVALKPQD